eukprot:SAG22_NODE_1734_length_3692_cov_2.728361_2_plen_160_part_00
MWWVSEISCHGLLRAACYLSWFVRRTLCKVRLARRRKPAAVVLLPQMPWGIEAGGTVDAAAFPPPTPNDWIDEETRAEVENATPVRGRSATVGPQVFPILLRPRMFSNFTTAGQHSHTLLSALARQADAFDILRVLGDPAIKVAKDGAADKTSAACAVQ